MSDRCIFTIVAKNYIHFARSLFASIRHHDEEIDLYLVLCDGASDETAINPEGDETFVVIPVSELPIPELSSMAFQYDVVEFCTAVKPFAFRYLFEQFGYKKILYFDPDIQIYDGFEDADDLLDRYNIVLTPHLTAPIDNEFRPNELDILRNGIYNLGFIGMKHHPESQKLLNWWAGHTEYDCIIDPDSGIFVDQKWMDLVPALFEGVYVNRDPGWNVAYWNLSTRNVAIAQGKYRINDSALFFFHFSGFKPVEHEFSVHQNRYDMDNLPEAVKLLVDDYKAVLTINGLNTFSKSSYGFGKFSDGSIIPWILRRAYRKYRMRGEHLPNPNGTDFKTEYFQLLNEPAIVSGRRHPLVTRLAYEIYLHRTDLMEQFSDLNGLNGERFAAWFVNTVGRSHSIPENLILPVSEKLSGSANYKMAISGKLVSNIYNQSTSLRMLTSRFFPATLRSRIRSWVYRSDRR